MDTVPDPAVANRWLSPGVAGIGVASLLSDLGHEVPTALLPGLVTSTLSAPASALGVIEGISDGLAGACRLAGGALADDPHRRNRIAVGGYTTTAVLSGLIGTANSAVQVGFLRAGAWAARGLRVPARNAVLADIVPPAVYGRAYGFERAMDNLGAIGGPLLALALVAAFSTRTAIALSAIPGLLAAVAIGYAIRQAHRSRPPAARTGEPRRIRLAVRPVLAGGLGPLLAAMAAFEVGNAAATLMILRASELLTPGRGLDNATNLALLLYLSYNIAATVASIPAGWVGDRRTMPVVLAAGFACFGLAYAGLALGPSSPWALLPCFVAAGIAIGCVEVAEHAAVAAAAPADVRGSAFGLLAGIQSLGNVAASVIAGVLWSAFSAGVAFAYLTAWMVVALVLLVWARQEPR